MISQLRFGRTAPGENLNAVTWSDPIKAIGSIRHLDRLAMVLMGLYIASFFSNSLTAIEEISFYGSLLIALSLFFFRRKDLVFATPFTLPLLFFVLWAFIGLFFALNKPNSAHDFYAHLLKYIVFLYLLVTFFCSRTRFIVLTWIFIIGTALFCFGGIIYFYPVLGHAWTDRFFLLGKQFLPYHDYLLVFALMLAVSHFSMKPDIKIRVALSICLSFISAALLLSQTRSALLAVAVSLLVFFYRRTLTYLLLFSVILLALIFPIKDRLGNFENILHNERIPTLRVFTEIVKNHPVVGVGFGMQTLADKRLLNFYNEKLPEKDRDPSLIYTPHNTFFDIAARTGLVGLAIYLFIVFTFFKMGLNMVKNSRSTFVKKWTLCILATFAAFFIQSMFSDASFGRQALVFYANLALMAILWRMHQSGPPAIERPVSHEEKRRS